MSGKKIRESFHCPGKNHKGCITVSISMLCWWSRLMGLAMSVGQAFSLLNFPRTPITRFRLVAPLPMPWRTTNKLINDNKGTTASCVVPLSIFCLPDGVKISISSCSVSWRASRGWISSRLAWAGRAVSWRGFWRTSRSTWPRCRLPERGCWTMPMLLLRNPCR